MQADKDFAAIAGMLHDSLSEAVALKSRLDDTERLKNYWFEEYSTQRKRADELEYKLKKLSDLPYECCDESVQ